MSKEISDDDINDKRLKEKLIKINSKLKILDEPKEKIKELDRSMSMKKQNINGSKRSSTLKFFDENLEDDFRNFNLFLPKIRLSQNTQVRSTFSQQKTNFEDRVKLSSAVILASENPIGIEKPNFTKLKKNNYFKKDYTFYENKYFEFTYNDLPDKM